MGIKFCLTSQQSEVVLSQADEIITTEIKAVRGLAKKFPRAKIIFSWPASLDSATEQSLWDELLVLNVENPNRIIVCLRFIEHAEKCKSLNLKFYWGYKAVTFYELQMLSKLGAEYIKIGGPLVHSFKELKRFNIPVRIAPNVAVDEVAGQEFAYAGSWIRPEEYPFYNRYNVVYEFEGVNTVQEKTLFDLYKNKKEWSGPLKDIILNMPFDAVNRLISPDLTKSRAFCGQRCMKNDSCKLCLTTLKLADPNFLKKVQGMAKKGEQNGVTV